jgi:hypothetical protein
MNTKLETALYAAGIRTFRNCSCNPTLDAQNNLSGLTHYADRETLRAFKARILECVKIDAICDRYGSWLLLGIVESVGSKPADIPGGKFRARIFDVTGREIGEIEDWFKTSKAARKALFRRADEIDARAHTETRLRELAQADMDRATKVLAALQGS